MQISALHLLIITALVKNGPQRDRTELTTRSTTHSRRVSGTNHVDNFNLCQSVPISSKIVPIRTTQYNSPSS
ncbi:hypothetical protein PF008_g10968 [Phytophthora fragariae]|uniref:RxLR effector protein n=1 Tax=Phytophthora fragariae TaxID=53985 RepID=A0A6G0RT28_9STRA|nr:hypothetical protein PF008_g10968 [Phytophthora fragariae]